MTIELLRDTHSVGEANDHLQFTAAYRQPITDPTTRVLTRDYLLAAARLHSITVAAIGFGPDHVHLFTAGARTTEQPRVANLLKGFSSRMMQLRHRGLFGHLLWEHKFCTNGYFYWTVGAVNAVTVEHYVAEGQRKHWKAGTGSRRSSSSSPRTE